MRPATIFGVFILFLSWSALAGQVYGSLTTGGAAVSKAAIQIDCNGNVTPTTTSDDGSYRVVVPQQGRCTLTITNYPGRPSAVVFSYPNPAQYDFELVRRGDGNYDLRRQ